MLVAIGVIGVLISILVPALRGARASAGETASLANARSVATLIDDHARTHGAYPVAHHEKVHPVDPFGGGGITINDPVGIRWETYRFWWDAMEDEGFDAAPHWEAFFSPGSDPETHRDPVHYTFSNSFVAAPALWRPSHDPDDTSVLRDVRPSDVQFPSRKAMVWDSRMAYLTGPARDNRYRRTPVAFADTHAEIRDRAEATAPVPNVLNNNADAPLHNTPEGVEGYDY